MDLHYFALNGAGIFIPSKDINHFVFLSNHNSLLCYREKALDELGDTSSHEVRRQCFDEIDADGSNSVDFEEFLGVGYAIN